MKCIGVRDLSVEDRRGTKILDSAAFDVECGEFVAVSGPSGGGVYFGQDPRWRCRQHIKSRRQRRCQGPWGRHPEERG